MLDTGGPFRTGANLPWLRYGCDFGANAWQPGGGLGATGVPGETRRHLEQLAAGGSTLVRWFLWCDGRAGIRFDQERPVGLDAACLRDVGAALALADDLGLDLIFTLFDFHWCRPGRMVNGVQLGGRSAVLSRDDRRHALVDLVVAPLFGEIGGHPRIAAWDVINEPEWVTGGVRRFRPWSHVGRTAMRALIADVAALAHRLTPHPVTVGSASVRWLPLVEGLDLDFYQVHWYDRIDDARPPRTLPVGSLGLPVMLGEFPTRQSSVSPASLVGQAAGAGCFAALPWSVGAEDGFSCGGDALCRMLAEIRNGRGASDV